MACALADRGRSRTALRVDLFRQLGVAKSAKYSSMPVVWRLDLTKNLSLSARSDFYHGLLGVLHASRCPVPSQEGSRQANDDQVFIYL